MKHFVRVICVIEEPLDMTGKDNINEKVVFDEFTDGLAVELKKAGAECGLKIPMVKFQLSNENGEVLIER